MSARSPLLFMHGFSLLGGDLPRIGDGSGARTWDAATTLLNQVTGLDADTDPCVTVMDRPTVREDFSIAANANGIVAEAALLQSVCGAPVNVIAHSKGGLDARLAAHRNRACSIGS